MKRDNLDKQTARALAMYDLLGFLFASLCAYSLLSVENLGLSLIVMASALVSGLLIVLLASGGISVLGTTALRKRTSPTKRTYWVAIGIACVTLSFAVVLENTPHSPQLAGLVLLLNAFAMIAAFRVGVVLYGLLAVAFGIDIWRNLGLAYGALGMIACALLLSSCAYLVHLYTDNREDLRRFIQNLRGPSAIRDASYAVAVWLPALLLTSIGWYVNASFQNGVKQSIYDSQLLALDPSDSRTGTDRDIQRDALHTIDVREQLLHTALDEDVRQSLAEASSAFEATPPAITKAIAAQKPRPIGNQPCDRFRFRVLGKSVTMRSPCRALIASIDKRIDRGFTSVQMRVNDSLARAVSRFQGTRDDLQTEVLQIVHRQITLEHDSYRRAVIQGFQAATALKYLSYLILIGGLISGLQMAIGRTFYDRQRAASGMLRTFQLESGDALPLTGHNLNVRDASVITEQLFLGLIDDRSHCPKCWYVAGNVTTGGPGHEQDLCVPLWRQCMFQRILSGKWIWSRMTLDGKSDPSISATGDTALVVIRIESGQPVAFRLSDLAAFSDGITLASEYCAHMGGYLLGLGSFQSVALANNGGAFIVLRTHGMTVANSVRGSAPGYRLLAWDRRQQFAVSQTRGVFKMWLNEPSLVFLPTSGSMVLDEEVNAPRILQRVWRLLKYLFLPF